MTTIRIPSSGVTAMGKVTALAVKTMGKVTGTEVMAMEVTATVTEPRAAPSAR